MVIISSKLIMHRISFFSESFIQ